ncbi:unnamed protein product [Dicrocoelium dendriticum]|nr:unnamed protein product [Dicrocoelium dendriticum]
MGHDFDAECYLPRVNAPCSASPEAVMAAAAFNAVRRWFTNPVAATAETAASGYWANSALGPPLSGSSSTRTTPGSGSVPRIPLRSQHALPPIAYMPAPHRGHHSSGYVPNSSISPLVRGGKKRSHSQSSAHELFDISSLTRSSQGSLNIIQAMRSSRSMVSSTGGSYGHLSAGKMNSAHYTLVTLRSLSSQTISSTDCYEILSNVDVPLFAHYSDLALKT